MEKKTYELWDCIDEARKKYERENYFFGLLSKTGPPINGVLIKTMFLHDRDITESEKYGFIINTKLSKNVKLWNDEPLEYEVNYKDGIQHGVARFWDTKTTELIEESNWKNGKLHGIQKFYFENGKPKTEANYKDGELFGKQKEWSKFDAFPREFDV